MLDPGRLIQDKLPARECSSIFTIFCMHQPSMMSLFYRTIPPNFWFLFRKQNLNWVNAELLFVQKNYYKVKW